ncbi:MAG: hypothetical protein V4722_05305 [Bacteroidota bacterium]
MIEILENYKLLKDSLGDLIKKSGYRNDYLADKIGMGAAYFSVKKKNASWSDAEVEKLIRIINSEEAANYFDTVMIKAKMKKGKYISSDEFEKKMGWK